MAAAAYSVSRPLRDVVPVVRRPRRSSGPRPRSGRGQAEAAIGAARPLGLVKAVTAAQPGGPQATPRSPWSFSRTERARRETGTQVFAIKRRSGPGRVVPSRVHCLAPRPAPLLPAAHSDPATPAGRGARVGAISYSCRSLRPHPLPGPNAGRLPGRRTRPDSNHRRPPPRPTPRSSPPGPALPEAVAANQFIACLRRVADDRDTGRSASCFRRPKPRRRQPRRGLGWGGVSLLPEEGCRRGCRGWSGPYRTAHGRSHPGAPKASPAE